MSAKVSAWKQATGFTGAFAFTQINGLKMCAVAFSYGNFPFFFSQRNINGIGKDGHAGSLTPQRNWSQRRKGHLWWSSMSQTLKAKKVIRHYCARKLRHAFVESLKEHGYDRYGINLQGSDHGTLLGTLQLHSMKHMITAPIAKVKDDTDRIVKWLEKQQAEERIVAAKRRASIPTTAAKVRPSVQHRTKAPTPRRVRFDVKRAIRPSLASTNAKRVSPSTSEPQPLETPLSQAQKTLKPSGGITSNIISRQVRVVKTAKVSDSKKANSLIASKSITRQTKGTSSAKIADSRKGDGGRTSPNTMYNASVRAAEKRLRQNESSGTQRSAVASKNAAK